MKWGVRKDRRSVRKGRKQLSKISGRDKKTITDKEARDFRNEVKYAKRKGITADVSPDKYGNLRIDSYRNSKNEKIGKEYAEHILAQVNKEKKYTTYCF
jgi:hypothetical protein